MREAQSNLSLFLWGGLAGERCIFYNIQLNDLNFKIMTSI